MVHNGMVIIIKRENFIMRLGSTAQKILLLLLAGVILGLSSSPRHVVRVIR